MVTPQSSADGISVVTKDNIGDSTACISSRASSVGNTANVHDLSSSGDIFPRAKITDGTQVHPRVLEDKFIGHLADKSWVCNVPVKIRRI
jgi:hypothetical protein